MQKRRLRQLELEGSDMTDKQVASLSVAATDAFKKRNNRHDVDWFYTTCSQGRDIDPQIQIVLRRVVGSGGPMPQGHTIK